jgi:hypothetical protein
MSVKLSEVEQAVIEQCKECKRKWSISFAS